MRSVKVVVMRPFERARALRTARGRAQRGGRAASGAAQRPGREDPAAQPEPALRRPGHLEPQRAAVDPLAAHADREPAAPQRRDCGAVAGDAVERHERRERACAGRLGGRDGVRDDREADAAVGLDVPDEVARPEVDAVPAERLQVERAGVRRPRPVGADAVLRRHRAGAVAVRAREGDARCAGVRRDRRATVDASGGDRRRVVDLHAHRPRRLGVALGVGRPVLDRMHARGVDGDRRGVGLQAPPSTLNSVDATPAPAPSSAVRVTVTVPSNQPSVPSGAAGLSRTVVRGAARSTSGAAPRSGCTKLPSARSSVSAIR